MSAGLVFYIGAALLFLVAACSDGSDAAAEPAEAGSEPDPRTISTEARPMLMEDSAPAVVEQAEAVEDSSPAAFNSVVIVAAGEEVLADVYEQSLPSVVYVSVVRRLDPDDPQFGFGFGGRQQGPLEEYRRGAGSGFVWDEEGHILTNWHVVEGSDTVSVTFADGQEADAEFLGGDPDSDLAVLKIDPAVRRLQPLPRGDIEDLRVGQLALAIGSPFGQDFTLTSGIVSALGRTIRSGSGPYSIPLVIQTDAPINPGNSGGPLMDRLGRVIGINTQILSRSGSNAGVGFAVPIDIAKRVVPDLIAHGKYEYAWLGISGTTLNADVAEEMGLPGGTRGVLVIGVTDDSPASEGGLSGGDEEVTIEGEEFTLGGDVITAIDEEEIREMHDLISYLVEHTRPGDEIDLDVLHPDGAEDTIAVTLGTRPDNS